MATKQKKKTYEQKSTIAQINAFMEVFQQLSASFHIDIHWAINCVLRSIAYSHIPRVSMLLLILLYKFWQRQKWDGLLFLVKLHGCRRLWLTGSQKCAIIKILPILQLKTSKMVYFTGKNLILLVAKTQKLAYSTPM